MWVSMIGSQAMFEQQVKLNLLMTFFMIRGTHLD